MMGRDILGKCPSVLVGNRCPQRVNRRHINEGTIYKGVGSFKETKKR